MSCWMNIYYIVILAWAVFYFFMSMRAGKMIIIFDVLIDLVVDVLVSFKFNLFKKKKIISKTYHGELVTIIGTLKTVSIPTLERTCNVGKHLLIRP